ncbi:hypothetical protein CcaverHIS002_0604350 [Cutaneotrichosporon cavernicola]|uniref:DFDF domain-containing protein n=1 Tax=Cutaneotrichosporon cavernicola TaxID=279322 RepID=A0AA48L8I1_9TREE|nr:uncharacterized protein CcaverHIS019_0603820 [Cutaneotrichosporon cavernicola]BEI86148.1 hypothetical protein CcaverHIS002_0604350 [Cutaneotrichosporon cavernicola]BEI93923.1 hypothetical protein CcaverHIS019_0603820 [Cutaneotrichosporon cavernicola]BEJ01701.1 hypothetical protein CcaverHIS631_0603830 [Cutaneotrichosporon cavernicola]BEJ09468.1 hypothetical protein CcaverHIS641_0603830 [Cutaneotrichosporon cavernicola]
MDYTQYAGQPFQVISKLQVRYTGIFQDIDQDSQTLCLSDVFNHGTEDRQSERVLPGSNESLGWVRFHTNSILSLALVDNYVPPVSNAPVDPILASVSGPRGNHHTSPPPRGVAGLPPKPHASATSASTAMDRVQKSLSELNVDAGRPRRKTQPPAVPDAEFDFSKGNERFQKERQAHKAQEDHKEDKGQEEEAADLGEPDNKPHPSAVVQSPEVVSQDSSGKGPARKVPTYNKASFFDNISSDSSRVSRAEERHRNLDTFGEAGGDGAQAYRYGQQGGRGGMQGRGRGRGGGSGRRGGYHSTPSWAT